MGGGGFAEMGKGSGDGDRPVVFSLDAEDASKLHVTVRGVTHTYDLARTEEAALGGRIDHRGKWMWTDGLDEAEPPLLG